MDKEELGPIIIHEFKTSWTDSAEKVADRILAKIPDDDFDIIASVSANYLRLEQIELIGLIVDKYEDKNIEIGIRIKKNNE